MPQPVYFAPLTGLTLVVEPTEAFPHPSAFAQTPVAAIGLHQADGNPIGSVTVLFGERGDDIWVAVSGPILCTRDVMDAWERAAAPNMTILLSDGRPGRALVERQVVMPPEMVLHLRAAIVTLGGEVDPDAAIAEHCSHESDEGRLAAGQLWVFEVDEHQATAE
ncbi:hypothetical protein [Cupriavidus sp. TMH.W2]|uniref:hypothetical protein n=1 Tax=Cupriavidus sp. TMH.W2 TaxID=3434465 RepID=UPI003D77DDB2